jgi:hypothetical protein
VISCAIMAQVSKSMIKIVTAQTVG